MIPTNAVNAPQTLPQWLRHNAVTRGSDIGQRHKREGIWKQFSWARIYDEVRALAMGLVERGVQRGNTVMLISENRPELYWAEWAAMALGAKIVAMYPDASEAEIEFVAEDSGVVCVFAEDQEQVDKVLPVAKRNPRIATVVWWEPGGLWDYQAQQLLSWDALQQAGRRLHAQDSVGFESEVQAGASGDIALLSYTSGTTGKPKGVISTHAALMHNGQLLGDTLGVPEHCEYLSYIPLSWGTEQWMGVALGLIRPMRVNFAERPDQIQEAIRELACEAVFFGPRQWESLAATVHVRTLDAGPLRRAAVNWGLGIGQRVRVAAMEGRASSLIDRALMPLAELLVLRPLRSQLGLLRARIAMTGGAAIAPDVVRLFAGMGVALRNLYGSSEVGVVSAHVGERYDFETIGTPVTQHTRWGGEMSWRLTPDGELQVRSGTGFTGYWGQPEKTAERIEDGWYRTGDAIGLSEGGDLIYYDRVEHMSTLASNCLYSKQFIEVRLRFSPYIRDVMVIGDSRHGFVSALINIDMEVFSRWAEQRGLSFSTFTDLSQRPEVIAQIEQEVERVNKALPEGARVLRFANLPKELDADEGELTRTRKLKREVVAQRYSALIDALYDGASEVALDIAVRYQDGRTAALKAVVAIAGRPLESATPASAAAATAPDEKQRIAA